MGRFVQAFCLCIFLVCAVGCGTKQQQAVPVQGTVTLDGRPLPEGEVSLGQANAAPMILSVKDGTFSGQVPVGINRVEVRAYKVGQPLSTDPQKTPTKVNFLPARFHAKSELSATVTSNGPNQFTFEVRSR